MMDSIDQISALTFIDDRQIAARVDYRTCTCCGFRLMRVETTIISDQHLTVENCPICEQFDPEELQDGSCEMSAENRLHYFDLWLRTHGLDRETLVVHYHLQPENFFDELI